mmetsp:Transcript_7823/g.16260  ORF Transcript_7823/g.16260 Transcript_7823/m.16260 type:complete len:222 (+) Transcript_7823:118-783(+)
MTTSQKGFQNGTGILFQGKNGVHKVIHCRLILFWILSIVENMLRVLKFAYLQDGCWSCFLPRRNQFLQLFRLCNGITLGINVQCRKGVAVVACQPHSSIPVPRESPMLFRASVPPGVDVIADFGHLLGHPLHHFRLLGHDLLHQLQKGRRIRIGGRRIPNLCHNSRMLLDVGDITIILLTITILRLGCCRVGSLQQHFLNGVQDQTSTIAKSMKDNWNLGL